MNPDVNRVAAPTRLVWAVAATILTLVGCGEASTAPLEASAASSVSVAVEPTTAVLQPGGTAMLAAAVTGTAETQVTWTVVESGGGSVSATGQYVAPTSEGTYHVKASAVADPGVAATVTVVVASQPVQPPGPSSGPRMGANLEGIAFFTKNDAFNNMMTQAGIDGGAVWNPDNRDANGWPTSTSASTILRRAMSVAPGTYRVSFKAKVSGATASITSCTMSGRTETASGDGAYPYLVSYNAAYTSGDMTFSYANAAGGITAVKVLHPGSTDSAVLSPLFRAAISHFGAIRFYQAQGFEGYGVNSSTEKFWSERRRPTYATWNGDTTGLAAVNGIPYEAMILMANDVAADVWVNVPYLTIADTGVGGEGRGDGQASTNDYLIRMAQVFKCGSDGSEPWVAAPGTASSACKAGTPAYPPLASGHHVYVEFSNELWNGSYPYSRDKNWTAAASAREYAAGNPHGYLSSAVNGRQPSASRTGRMQMAISDIWRSVWGDAAMGSTVRVVSSGFTGDDYSSQPLDYIATRGTPSHYVYGFAVAPYFNQNSGTADQVIASMAADATNTNSGTDDNGGALIRDHDRAVKFGIKMVAYEGGIGNMGLGTSTCATIRTRVTQRTQVLQPYFQRWFSDSTADVFMYYSLSRADDGSGCFGLMQSIDDQGSTNYRWQGVLNAISGNFSAP